MAASFSRAHRLPVHPELLRDVAEIDTAFDQCLNRHEVLQSQHPSLLPIGLGEGTFLLAVGGLPISAFLGLLPSALTTLPTTGTQKVQKTQIFPAGARIPGGARTRSTSAPASSGAPEGRLYLSPGRGVDRPRTRAWHVAPQGRYGRGRIDKPDPSIGIMCRERRVPPSRTSLAPAPRRQHRCRDRCTPSRMAVAGDAGAGRTRGADLPRA
jgi:hypothetical protein